MTAPSEKMVPAPTPETAQAGGAWVPLVWMGVPLIAAILWEIFGNH